MQKITVLGLKTEFKSPEELVNSARALGREHKVMVQVLNPHCVLSAPHIYFSCFHAFKAFGEERGIAKTIENEVLARVACTTKLEKALEIAGVKNAKRVILVVGSEGKLAREIAQKLGKEAPELLERTKEKEERVSKLFGIKKSTSFSLEDALLEKIAMLGTIG
ncbi:MAG: KEOPS complex subunit Cgi121 [Candidatus Micrarchaeota archaeon]